MGGDEDAPDFIVVGEKVALGPLRRDLAATYARWENQLEVRRGLADPSLRAPWRDGLSAVAMAARTGRADALELFRRRGCAIELAGDDAFFAALTRADRAAALAFLAAEPRIVERLKSSQSGIVATLAGAGNTAAVALALDLGFPLSADALSLAVWRERAATVRLLLVRGAAVSASVLSLAERALTEMSEWTPHRSGEIIDALSERS